MDRWTRPVRRYIIACMETSDNVPCEEIELPVEGGSLSGTLCVPAAADKSSPDAVPAVLILAGSGPTDRDGNSPLLSGRNDALRMVADALLAAGIASLRADKRGIGKSSWSDLREENLSFDDFALDAARWVDRLRRDGRFGRIVVLGHSEGGLVGLVAAQNRAVDGIILAASLGESYQTTLLQQLASLPDALRAESSRIIAELEQGRPVETVRDELAPLFRPSVQPFLISAFRYDPAELVSRSSSPLLIIAGERDLQVPLSHARRLRGGRPDAGGNTTELVVVEGMNHVLKRVGESQEENIAAYSDPSLPLAEGLMAPIVDFVKGLS